MEAIFSSDGKIWVLKCIINPLNASEKNAMPLDFSHLSEHPQGFQAAVTLT